MKVAMPCNTDTFRSTEMEGHFFFLRCLACRTLNPFGEIEALSDCFVNRNAARELELPADNILSPANKIVKENREFGYRSSMLNLLITFITFSGAGFLSFFTKLCGEPTVKSNSLTGVW